MPGSACLVTNAHEMTGDLPEAADNLSLIMCQQKQPKNHILFNSTSLFKASIDSPKLLERKDENLEGDRESQSKP